MESFLTPQFLAALLAFIGGLSAVYIKFRNEMAEFRNSELARIEKRLAKRDKRIEDLESEVDQYRIIAQALRDEASIYKTLLHQNRIEIPKPRRRGDLTHPLEQMLDELNDRHERNGNGKDEDEE